MPEQKCATETCDVFEFMSRDVGMTVLHPGGLWATDRMAELCHLGKDTKVLDIACCKGTSALHWAKKYDCQIAGIDLDEDLITQAVKQARKEGLDGKVEVQTEDGLHLPFGDNEFDVTLSQAFLILVKDKKRVVKEALQVTHPGGYLGWLELSFRKKPAQRVFAEAISSVSALCIQNTLTFVEWESLFREGGMIDIEMVTGEMGIRSRRMFQDEGFVNTMRVMSKWLLDPRIRQHMDAIFQFFKDNTE